jgi:hypothetical protein
MDATGMRYGSEGPIRGFGEPSRVSTRRYGLCRPHFLWLKVIENINSKSQINPLQKNNFLHLQIESDIRLLRHSPYEPIVYSHFCTCTSISIYLQSIGVQLRTIVCVHELLSTHGNQLCTSTPLPGEPSYWTC